MQLQKAADRVTDSAAMALVIITVGLVVIALGPLAHRDRSAPPAPATYRSAVTWLVLLLSVAAAGVLLAPPVAARALSLVLRANSGRSPTSCGEIRYARDMRRPVDLSHVEPSTRPTGRPIMISLGIQEIATVVGGTVEGDPTGTVTAPAVIDGRQAEPGGLFVAFAGEHVDGHDYAEQAGEAGAVAVLGSRPTALPTVVVDDTRAALQLLAVHVVARLRDRLTVVGVTGSQGKTSTKDLLAAVLSSAAPTVATIGSRNNELGVPLTMLRADRTTRFLVLEMGARHIGDIAHLASMVPPDIAVVLNVGQAHIGEFGSREAIVKAKSELVRGLVPGGTAILYADDPRVVAMRALTDGPVLTFGRAEHADVRVLDLSLDGLGRPSFTLRGPDNRAPVTLPIAGAHQALNAAAAATAGLAAGVPLDRAVAALTTASVSKARLEVVRLPTGGTLIDDSYNANPDSTRAALDALASIEAGRRIAVLGEMLDLGASSEAEHHGIGKYAASRADVIVAVGQAAQPIAAAAGERAIMLATSDDAIAWLRNHITADDAVLVKASRGVNPGQRSVRLEEVAAALMRRS
jgi:UDP-N-acetylmuramoyl-tripeptide--D-alanyl-D-alanine ligase